MPAVVLVPGLPSTPHQWPHTVQKIKAGRGRGGSEASHFNQFPSLPPPDVNVGRGWERGYHYVVEYFKEPKQESNSSESQISLRLLIHVHHSWSLAYILSIYLFQAIRIYADAIAMHNYYETCLAPWPLLLLFPTYLGTCHDPCSRCNMSCTYAKWSEFNIVLFLDSRTRLGDRHASMCSIEWEWIECLL